MVREVLLFSAFNINITNHPHQPITYSTASFLFPSLYLSVFDSTSLFFGPQQCPCLISFLLFYSFFHFLSHLFCLTLTVYPDCLSPLLPLHFTRSVLLHPTPPSFHPNCSFLWTLQLGCSAFRRREYLQFCMFENLWWARDSHHCSSVFECVWMCVCVCTTLMNLCMWISSFMSVGLCISVCVYCWFVQSNPDYTHLPVSHFRKKRRWGKGEEEGEGEKGEERCSATMANTLHMNNRVRSVIPPGVCCIGRPAAKAAFRSGNNWEYQLSLQEDYTPSVENWLFYHIYPIIFTVFITSFHFFSCSLRMFVSGAGDTDLKLYFNLFNDVF